MYFDLEKSIRIYILDLGWENELKEQLSFGSTEDLIKTYFSWRDRQISVQRREVHYSKEIIENPKFQRYASIIFDIQGKCHLGETLQPFLSERTAIRNFKHTSSTAANGQLDLLCELWGIFHLHLSLKIRSDGFVRRTNDLLFAMFVKGHAFFLDIGNHQSFFDERYQKIAIDNWPELELIPKMSYVSDLANPRDAKQRKGMYFNNINVGFLYKGNVYFPRGPVSLAGTSINVTRRLDAVMETIEQTSEIFLSEASILSFLKESGVTALPPFEFSFEIDEQENWYLFEKRNGIKLNLLP